MNDPAIPAGGAIGDRVWIDLDRDGLQDPGEPGARNIQVQLLDESDSVIDETHTAPGGEYSFINLPAGSYQIQILLSDKYRITPAQNQGADDTIDSDVDPNSGRSSLIDPASTNWSERSTRESIELVLQMMTTIHYQES